MATKKPRGGRARRDPKSDVTSPVKRSRRGGTPEKGAGKGAGASSSARAACKKCGQVHKRCTAHNKAGGPCGQQAKRGTTVCRSHGANAPQTKRKAAERLEDARQEMLNLLEPLLGRLREMAADPATNDADIIKVFREIANRVGLSERHVIVPGAETAFDRLMDLDRPDSAFIMRGADLAEQLNAMDPHPELPTNDADSLGGVGEDLEAFLANRERERAREASTHLNNSGHEVVTGSVQRQGLDPFRMEERRREEYERSRSEYGPRAPKDDPDRAYEDRLRERIEESEGR